MLTKISRTVFLLVLLICNRTVAQVTRGSLEVTHFERDNTLDSLSNRLSRAGQDTNRVYLFTKISSIYWHKEKPADMDSCLYFAGSAYQLSEKLNYTWGKNEALFLRCRAYAEKNDLKSAKSLLSLVYGEMSIRLLLVISEYYIFLPEQQSKNLEMGYVYLRQARRKADEIHSEFWQRYCLLLSGKYYFKRGEYVLGEKYFFQIINDYKRAGNLAGQAYYWSELGSCLSTADGAYKVKIQAYETAYQLFLSLNKKQDALASLGNLAEVHVTYNHLDLAEKQILTLLDMYEKWKIHPGYQIYYLAAQIFFYRNNLAKGLKYLYLATGKVSPEDTHEKMDADELTAKFYYALGSYRKSIDLNQKILDNAMGTRSYSIYTFCFRIISNKIALGEAASALAYLKKFIRQHPPVYLNDIELMDLSFGNIYNALKRYGEAESFYLKMISIDKQLRPGNTRLKSGEAYFTIGNFYMQQRRYQEARPCFMEAIKNNDTENPIPASRENIAFRLYQIDSATGNYLAAIKYFGRYQRIKDSIWTIAKSREVGKVQFEYKRKQNEQSLRLLRAEEIKKDQELKGLNLQRNLIIGGIGLLIIATALAVRGYRMKQVSIRRLQFKQEEIDLQNLVISHKNESLRALVADKDELIRDKESLLRELNHRVKNNLQMVISLLDKQVSFLNDSVVLAALQESKNRIQAMALIHQKFNYLPGFNVIDMEEYIFELVTYLGFSFSTQKQNIQIKHFVDIDKLSISQVVPLGLILNEAVTNSIKHAFIPDKGGLIEISLVFVAEEVVCLTVADNGKGLSPDFELKKGNSLGMEMLINLSKQLGGTLRLKNKDGLTITIEFKRTNDHMDTEIPDLT